MNKNRFEKFYVFFLSIIAAIPAMSTDIYIAAIPRIAENWQVSESKVSLSLVLWFAAFSVFLLILGPISDKLGRRPVLLGGLWVFVIATILCATAGNVGWLIGFRILQGSAAAAPSAMFMAICRDRYEAAKRKYILAYIGVILSVMPMVAPMIGAMLLSYTNWRAIFIFQAFLGAIALAISTNYKETLEQPTGTSFIAAYGKYLKLLKNTNYMLANKTAGLILGPFYGFVAFSSIVYMKIYGLTTHQFSLLFGLNAFMSMSGAYACTKLAKFYSDKLLLSVCFFGCFASGLGILIFGQAHITAFFATMSIYTFFCGLSRPISGSLILELIDSDIGSASSFLIFYQFIVGAICMALATAEWKNQILAFGLMATVMPMIVLILWAVLLRRLNPEILADSKN